MLLAAIQLSLLVSMAGTPDRCTAVSPSSFFGPARFLHFAAIGVNGKVSVGWRVTGEAEQFEYVIERSMDGNDFIPVGTLIYKPAITPVNNYSFTDLTPVVNHVNYYRVRSLDVKGHSTLSPVVKVKLSTPVGALFVGPSPANTAANLNLVARSRGTVSIRILNGEGHSCWHLHYSVVAGPNVLMLDGLDKLADGSYTVQCTDGKKTREVPLVIKH